MSATTLRRGRPDPRRRAARAILLRRTPYGESSAVASVMTSDAGRIDLLARGAYRPTSRFYCVLDAFHTLELGWTERPRAELHLLSSGDVVRRRREIPTDLSRYRAAQGMVELAELAAAPGRRDPDLFRLLEAGLERLELGAPDPALERVRFDLAFLALQGLSPALDGCASCGRPAPAQATSERQAFSARAGGRLCRACALRRRAEGGTVGTLPAALLERIAAVSGGAEDETALGTRTERAELVEFADRYLDVHLETRPKSRRSAPQR